MKRTVLFILSLAVAIGLQAQSQEINNDSKTISKAEEYLTKAKIFSESDQVDSVVYYLVERSLLDTTNMEWLGDVALFYIDIMHISGLASEDCNRGRKFGDTVSADDDSDWIQIYCNIGDVYWIRGNHDKAMFYFNKATEIGEQNLNKNCLCLSSLYRQMGFLYSVKQDYDKALESSHKARKIYEQVYDKTDLDLASIYEQLGHIYADKNDNGNSLLYYHKAEEIYKQISGKKSRDFAFISLCLGEEYHNLKDYDKALQYYHTARKINEQFGDKESLELQYIYSALGRVYTDTKKYNKA